MQESTTKVTGIVIAYNEEKHLRECLQSLAFCEQLVVVDLGSSDRCVQIARECGAEIVSHPHVPLVEMVWGDVLPLARHDWILRADPDEVFSQELAGDLLRTLSEEPQLSVVFLPHRYHFFGKELATTTWGNITHAAKAFHRERVAIEPHVHRGISPKRGYEEVRIPFNGTNAIQHYWADSYAQLFEKHWRYIKLEGEARYKHGERAWLGTVVRGSCVALAVSLFTRNGWKGGFPGVFLSCFYSWYEGMSLLSLWRYQTNVSKMKALSWRLPSKPNTRETAGNRGTENGSQVSTAS